MKKDKNKKSRAYNKKLWLEVHLRDKGRCQNKFCFYRGDSTNQHHIHDWSSYPKLRYDADNLITLCSRRRFLFFFWRDGCHEKFHKWNGGYRKSCNKESLSNWLTLNAFYKTIAFLVSLSLIIILELL